MIRAAHLRRLTFPGLVTAVAFAALVWGRGYPWQLAVLVAGAIGALVYTLRRTGEILSQERKAIGLDTKSDSAALAAETTPRPDEQRASQEQMRRAAEHETDQAKEEP